MTKRPVFLVGTDISQPVIEEFHEFKWHGGFSLAQKLRNIDALHLAISNVAPSKKILEISTKSADRIGQALSAFNLRLEIPIIEGVALESAYQATKVFENGGPYTDLLEAEPIRAKKDPRLKNSGALKYFEHLGEMWPLKADPSIYDWLYVQAIKQANVIDELAQFDAFTDIEFNPKKSFNCQAKSAAICAFFWRQFGEEWFAKASEYCLTSQRRNQQQSELFNTGFVR